MVKVTVFSKVFAHPTVSSENHLLKRQYEKHFFSFALSFFVALAVVEPKSKIRTVGQDHDRQYRPAAHALRFRRQFRLLMHFDSGGSSGWLLRHFDSGGSSGRLLL